jgi:hypothetical protein
MFKKAVPSTPRFAFVKERQYSVRKATATTSSGHTGTFVAKQGSFLGHREPWSYEACFTIFFKVTSFCFPRLEDLSHGAD